MKELKFKFDLDCKFAVYVPSTSDAVNSCDNTEMVKYVMAELSKLFGGATASKSVGGWMSQTHGLILEDVTIVYAYCTSEQAANHFEDVFAICEKNQTRYETRGGNVRVQRPSEIRVNLIIGAI